MVKSCRLAISLPAIFICGEMKKMNTTLTDPFTAPQYHRSALITVDVQNDTLDDHLRKKGVSTLAFCGCNDPNCPRTSIYQASERDYRITVVVDALSGIQARDIGELVTIGVNCANSLDICELLDRENKGAAS